MHLIPCFLVQTEMIYIERSEIAKMMNKKYRMGSDGNTAQRRGCVLSLPVLVTDQPQPQTVFAQIQNTPLPALLISFSSLEDQNLK